MWCITYYSVNNTIATTLHDPLGLYLISSRCVHGQIHVFSRIFKHFESLQWCGIAWRWLGYHEFYYYCGIVLTLGCKYWRFHKDIQHINLSFHWLKMWKMTILDTSAMYVQYRFVWHYIYNNTDIFTKLGVLFENIGTNIITQREVYILTHPCRILNDLYKHIARKF